MFFEFVLSVSALFFNSVFIIVFEYVFVVGCVVVMCNVVIFFFGFVFMFVLVLINIFTFFKFFEAYASVVVATLFLSVMLYFVLCFNSVFSIFEYFFIVVISNGVFMFVYCCLIVFDIVSSYVSFASVRSVFS